MKFSPDISTYIAGIKLSSCIYNASGCLCVTFQELDDLINSEAGAVLSKSCTMEPRRGNEEPRFFMNDKCSLNSMGIPNLGYEQYLKYHQQKKAKKPFILSIFPFNINEMEIMLKKIHESYEKTTGLVEINLSCPNLVAGKGESSRMVAYDFERFEKYLCALHSLAKICKNLRFGIKLPPYYEIKDFERASGLIEKYHEETIYFVVCINSVVNGLVIDSNSMKPVIKPKNGLGGLGGSFCKPTALSNVRTFYNLLPKTINIIGCGGIETASDVFEHLLCGATAVQVGTHLVCKGPMIFEKLNQELREILKFKEFTCIQEVTGQLKEI